MTSSEAKGRRRWWVWLIALAAIGLVAYLVFARSGRGKNGEDKSGKGKGVPRGIPVTAAAARSGELGVYLTGLGTVTPISTVTVRTRVDGQLISVAFREGQLVREGALLAQIDPRPFQVQLTQAQGQKGKDEALLENARLDLKRYQVLMDQDSIPRQQLDTQAATVRQFEAAVRSDEGQVESARLNLDYCRIAAPISGRIGLRLVDAGNMVHASDQNGLLVITQVAPINVVFTIPADQLPPVLLQMRAGKRLPVEAYDRDMRTRLADGALAAVDNQIDTATGTVRLKAMFANSDNGLFPNQFVNARLLVDTLRGAVIVPAASLQRSPQSTFVYVVKPDSTVDMRPVEVQLIEGDEAAIRKGIASGEAVVIDGVDKLQPGVKVAVAPGAKPGAGQPGVKPGEGQPGGKPGAGQPGVKPGESQPGARRGGK